MIIAEKPKKIRVMLTTFRDGLQSSFGGKVRLNDILPAMKLAAEEVGVRHFEFGGGARYQAPYFYLGEDPFEDMKAMREAVGPDVDIMFDAWNSWTVPYTTRMAELAAEYRPWWFEEPVLADMIPQYAEIRRSVTSTLISGGEHEYTRWGIKALLDAGAVDILQPDVTWAGGLTEMMKICALASSNAIPVVPHR